MGRQPMYLHLWLGRRTPHNRHCSMKSTESASKQIPFTRRMVQIRHNTLQYAQTAKIFNGKYHNVQQRFTFGSSIPDENKKLLPVDSIPTEITFWSNSNPVEMSLFDWLGSLSEQFDYHPLPLHGTRHRVFDPV